MRAKAAKTIAVLLQLDETLDKIYAETYEEYLFYKAECGGDTTPDEFIKETIEVTELQKQYMEYLFEVEDYYGISGDLAILLYRFTDAYQLIRTDLY